jgi:hypothetical protein
MIDCGACPVFATVEALALIARFPLAEARAIEPRRSFSIGMISFEAFPWTTRCARRRWATG